MRDLSLKQFRARAAAHGWKFDGFLGYYRKETADGALCVSVYNAGPNRRAQLAYLIERGNRHERTGK